MYLETIGINWKYIEQLEMACLERFIQSQHTRSKPFHYDVMWVTLNYVKLLFLPVSTRSSTFPRVAGAYKLLKRGRIRK